MGNGRDGSALLQVRFGNGEKQIMTTTELLLYGQACASVLMIFGWLVALRINNTSYVDVLWAYEWAFSASPICIWAKNLPIRPGYWFCRFCLFSGRFVSELICFPVVGENRRMPATPTFANTWERRNAGFFCFFQVQAFWIVLFASPFLILVQNPNPLGPLDYLGLAIWLIGFFGLSLADRQLARFKQSPGRTRSEVCESGLWKYSRHPNYFFEWILWLGYLPMGWHAQDRVYLIALPFVLYLFLTKITGIPFVEARKLEASGDAYRSHAERTSSFFPWIPKNKNTDS